MAKSKSNKPTSTSMGRNRAEHPKSRPSGEKTPFVERNNPLLEHLNPISYNPNLVQAQMDFGKGKEEQKGADESRDRKPTKLPQPKLVVGQVQPRIQAKKLKDLSGSFYDDKYGSSQNSGTFIDSANPGDTPASLLSGTTKPKAGDKMTYGSGGSYLSNEISYRVLRLRADKGSTVPAGHIHVPFNLTKAGNFSPKLTEEIKNKMIEIVRAAMPGL